MLQEKVYKTRITALELSTTPLTNGSRNDDSPALGIGPLCLILNRCFSSSLSVTRVLYTFSCSSPHTHRHRRRLTGCCGCRCTHRRKVDGCSAPLAVTCFEFLSTFSRIVESLQFIRSTPVEKFVLFSTKLALCKNILVHKNA